MLEEVFQEVYTKFKLHFYQSVFQRFATREATLTTVESFCMEGIMAMGEPTIAEFSRMMGISTPNAAYKIGSLVRKGYVTRKYVKTVLDREAFTPTSIGNGVAIPHGDQNEINEARVVIATLEKPILWDSEQVDVIFLLVVKMTNDFEIRRTQAFYKQYIKLVGTDEQVNVLRNFQTNVDFYKYLIK